MKFWTRFLPGVIDNRYRGHPAALWLFGLLTLMNLTIALVAIFSADGGAGSADGIPLARFGAEGAATVIGVVALLGLAKLLWALLAGLALIRYRALIPLLYLLIVVDHLAHKGLGLLKPITHVGHSTGSVVTLALIALSIVGLVLAVVGKGYRAEPAAS